MRSVILGASTKRKLPTTAVIRMKGMAISLRAGSKEAMITENSPLGTKEREVLSCALFFIPKARAER